tara:strand:+ start:148 stop:1353 length:1206 start_codon:yes stop_codon:yes gene_type:complete
MMTPEQMKQMQLMNSPGFRAAVQARPASNTPSMAPPAAAPQAPQGLLARMGAGIQNFRSDPEKMARLQMGLNSMRLNPDAGIAASAADTIKQSQERRMNTIDAASTIKFLQSRAATDPMAAQALGAIKANPSMVKDIMGAYLSGQFKSPHMSKNIGSTQVAQNDFPGTDIKAGDEYTYTLDPNTQTYKMERLGGQQLTARQIADNEGRTQLKIADIKEARTQAKTYYASYEQINKQMRSLRQAKGLLEKGGNTTGFLTQYLPTFDANTQLFRTIANEMGIDVINSATFGALSATELRLALSTGLPQNLDEAETLEYIDEKLAAQEKFRLELLRKTNRLNSGIGFTDWTREEQEEYDAHAALNLPPASNAKLEAAADARGESVQELWDTLNFKQRQAFGVPQ